MTPSKIQLLSLLLILEMDKNNGVEIMSNTTPVQFVSDMKPGWIENFDMSIPFMSKNCNQRNPWIAYLHFLDREAHPVSFVRGKHKMDDPGRKVDWKSLGKKCLSVKSGGEKLWDLITNFTLGEVKAKGIREGKSCTALAKISAVKNSPNQLESFHFRGRKMETPNEFHNETLTTSITESYTEDFDIEKIKETISAPRVKKKFIELILNELSNSASNIPPSMPLKSNKRPSHCYRRKKAFNNKNTTEHNKINKLICGLRSPREEESCSHSTLSLLLSGTGDNVAETLNLKKLIHSPTSHPNVKVDDWVKDWLLENSWKGVPDSERKDFLKPKESEWMTEVEKEDDNIFCSARNNLLEMFNFSSFVGSKTNKYIDVLSNSIIENVSASLFNTLSSSLYLPSEKSNNDGFETAFRKTMTHPQISHGETVIEKPNPTQPNFFQSFNPFIEVNTQMNEGWNKNESFLLNSVPEIYQYPTISTLEMEEDSAFPIIFNNLDTTTMTFPASNKYYCSKSGFNPEIYTSTEQSATSKEQLLSNEEGPFASAFRKKEGYTANPRTSNTLECPFCGSGFSVLVPSPITR